MAPLEHSLSQVWNVMIRVIAPALVALVAGCGGGSGSPTARAPAPPRTHPAATAPAQLPLPAPDAPLPRTPSALAARLTHTTRRLDVALAPWVQSRPSTLAKPPQAVTLLALDQQRIYRLLRGQPQRAQ